MARMRPSFTTSEAILKARHVEDRLMADTWSLDGYDLLPKLRHLECPGSVRKEIDGFFRNSGTTGRPK